MNADIKEHFYRTEESAVRRGNQPTYLFDADSNPEVQGNENTKYCPPCPDNSQKLEQEKVSIEHLESSYRRLMYVSLLSGLIGVIFITTKYL